MLMQVDIAFSAITTVILYAKPDLPNLLSKCKSIQMAALLDKTETVVRKICKSSSMGPSNSIES